MLKYLKTDVVFQEIPNEMSLAVAVSGCTIHCPGCHSRDLWEDKGVPLTIENLEALLQDNHGVSCLLIMGGEHDIDTLVKVFMHFHKTIKTAWYCGLDMLPKNKLGLLDYLDWIKLGHYDMELGGLDSPNTNQRLFQFDHYFSDVTALGAGWRDITYLFQNKTNYGRE